MNLTNEQLIEAFNTKFPVGITFWECDLLPGTGKDFLVHLTQPAQMLMDKPVIGFRRDGSFDEIPTTLKNFHLTLSNRI